MGKRFGNYFVYTDESWLTFEEKNMLIWALFVPSEVQASLYKELDIVYAKAKWDAGISKKRFINKLISAGEMKKLKQLLEMEKNAFEMKFQNINRNNLPSYKAFIDAYFRSGHCMFTALVIDKDDWKDKFPAWDLFVNRYTMLLSSTTNGNFDHTRSGFMILCDWISTPRWYPRLFEDDLLHRLYKRHVVKNGKDPFPVMGITHLASHSTLLLQVTDLLLWSVMAFMKIEQWLTVKDCKLEFANYVKGRVGGNAFTSSFTSWKPNYFSVWRFDPSKKSS